MIIVTYKAGSFHERDPCHMKEMTFGINTKFEQAFPFFYALLPSVKIWHSTKNVCAVFVANRQLSIY